MENEKQDHGGPFAQASVRPSVSMICKYSSVAVAPNRNESTFWGL